MRRLLVPALLVVGLIVPTVALSPTPAGAACASPTKQLSGTVAGEDGRYVSSQVGIELFDSQNRKLKLDGCLMTASGYSVNAHTNLKSSCCYLLPGTGASGPTYQGVTLRHDWQVTGLPSNAVTAWIEVYPKRCCVPAGTSNTDDSRYGRALRRPVPVSAGGIDIRLPLRCGLSGGGVSGRTGSIRGQVYDNGVLVDSARVGAWSQDVDTGREILGWGLDGSSPGRFDVEPLAPGTYSIIATANGISKQVFGVSVTACAVTTVNIAVRGTAPPVAALDRPVAGDWDGDGADEPGTFRPGGSWQLRAGSGSSDGTIRSFTYGTSAGDVPVVGDWDGDGTTDAGIFRKGTWHLRSSHTGQTIRAVVYGVSAGDVPVVGDWDGDGIDDLGIHRRGGTWHLRNADGSTRPVFTYGTSTGDLPVVGDWDGDDRDEPGIFRRGGTWHLRRSSAASSTTLPTFTYGVAAGDLPTTGDWSKAGASSVGIYRQGTWHLRSGAATSGTTIASFRYGS